MWVGWGGVCGPVTGDVIIYHLETLRCVVFLATSRTCVRLRFSLREATRFIYTLGNDRYDCFPLKERA